MPQLTISFNPSSFAEDSFGARTWVDDERSKLFVQNLMSSFQDESISKDTTTNADQYVENCNKFLGHIDETCKPEPPHQPSHFDTTERSIQNMVTDATKLSNRAVKQNSENNLGNGEDVLEVKSGSWPQKRKRVSDDDDSSSSGEEASDEEIMVFKKIFYNGMKQIDSTSKRSISPTFSKPNDISEPRNTTERLTYQGDCWWIPSNTIDLSRIRNRFFGSNKAVANAMIGDALSHRLDLKAKQNSGLLAALPNFVSNPTVRKLASCHLEKWLQSPALSGLARQLFSCIVGGIQNVDPPLPEDEIVIKSILSMNLKANQVSTNIYQFHVHFLFFN